MSKRLFVALPISEKLQNKILDWQKQYQNLPVLWLKGKNLHITLVPPWQELNTTHIINLLQTVKVQSFEVSFNKVTFGPNPLEPRLIWAEGVAPQEILNLKSSLENVLHQKPDSRQLKLHLTLARFRPENFDQFSIKQLNEQINWKEKINSFVLMESHLSPQGANYAIIKQVILNH